MLVSQARPQRNRRRRARAAKPTSRGYGGIPATYSSRFGSTSSPFNPTLPGEEPICFVYGGLSAKKSGCIPINPAYWLGTQVSELAKLYSQYRPNKIEIMYRPLCPTTLAGSFTLGTNWHIQLGDLETSLLTTPASFNTVPYMRAQSRVTPDFSRRQYEIETELGPTSTPFFIMWTSNANTDSVIGQLWIRYSFTFYNKNTSPAAFGLEYITASDALTRVANANMSIVVLDKIEPDLSLTADASWITLTLAVGAFISQNWDPISKIVSWIYNRVTAARTSYTGTPLDTTANSNANSMVMFAWNRRLPALTFASPTVEPTSFLESTPVSTTSYLKSMPSGGLAPSTTTDSQSSSSSSPSTTAGLY